MLPWSLGLLASAFLPCGFGGAAVGAALLPLTVLGAEAGAAGAAVAVSGAAGATASGTCLARSGGFSRSILGSASRSTYMASRPYTLRACSELGVREYKMETVYIMGYRGIRGSRSAPEACRQRGWAHPQAGRVDEWVHVDALRCQDLQVQQQAHARGRWVGDGKWRDAALGNLLRGQGCGRKWCDAALGNLMRGQGCGLQA